MSETFSYPSAMVIFRLDQQLYALAVEGVSEVMPLIAVNTVPEKPVDWLGVANIRNRVTPVIDLRLRLGLEAPVPDISAPLIVLKNEDKQVALLVDEIEQISYQTEAANFLSGEMATILHDNQLLTVLDWEKIIKET